MEGFVNMSDTIIDIKAWNANTPNEMGGFVAKQIKRAKQVDILTGYFFFDGFESIQKELGENPNVTLRILVGMDAGVDTSGLIHEVYKHENSHAGDDDAIRKEYLEQLRQVLRKWPTEQLTKYQSDAWKQYAGMIEKGHLQIRKTRRPNHSKVYIFHSDPANPDEQISYIGGSSNFSYSGLCDRNEFNIHVNQECAKDVVRLFNELWDNAVPIAEFKKPSETPEHGKPPIVDILNKETPDSPVSPFDAYMKVLYEYMALQKTDDKLDSRIRKIMRDAQFPDGGKIQEQQYQIDAIQRAQNILNTHGGVIIADVVGLGKSIVASVLASLSDAPGIIIAPAALCGEGNWASYIQTFRLKQDGWCCYSYGKINYIPQDVLLKARTIILDEAHNIRNPNTEAYQALKNICSGKKIIFLSATPFNNKPEDIYSLISLISSSHIVGYTKTDLETLFNGFKKQYQEIRKDPVASKEKAAALSEEIRKIVSRITIRRNRLDLIHKDSPYRQDMLPKISQLAPPQNEEFELTADIATFYEKILTQYFAGDRKQFQGFMYTPELSNGRSSDTEGQLFSMICHFIVTRWESSPVAFRKTVQNIKKALNASIKLFESEFGTFFRFSPGKTADAWDGNDTDLSKLPFDFEKEWKKAILKCKGAVYVRSQECRRKLLETVPDLTKEQVSILNKPENFLAGLKKDSEVLQGILEEFDRMKLSDPRIDAKFQCLVDNIRKVLRGEKDKGSEDEGKQRKIIVFSGFADTAKYVADNLSQPDLFPDSVMFVSGDNITRMLKKDEALKFGFSDEEFDQKAQAKQPLTMRDAVIRNFKFSALPKDPELRGRWKILVCTDVLSEGIDLNAAGIIFNYDMAYNPVRIIQRLGRINRISDKVFETLYRVNFFPTETGEAINNVKKISTLKAHFIQELFAEDFSILTEKEKVERAGLIFGADPANDPVNGPMSEDLQIRGMFTQALELKCGTDEVRQKKYLEKIKNLSGRFCKFYGSKEMLFFFFRDAVSISAIKLPRFASQHDADTVNVSLIEAVKGIQCEPNCKSVPFEPSPSDCLWTAFSTWKKKKFHISSLKQDFKKYQKACGIIQNMDLGTNTAAVMSALSQNPEFAKAVIKSADNAQQVLALYQKYNHPEPTNETDCFMTVGMLLQHGE